MMDINDSIQTLNLALTQHYPYAVCTEPYVMETFIHIDKDDGLGRLPFALTKRMVFSIL